MSDSARAIRVVIVDDEDHARDELGYLLSQYHDVHTVYSASTYQQALDAIAKYQPHLVFMDIQMPGMSGLKIAEKLIAADIAPLLVFATAHEEYAVKAFELDAVDYLLKPFSKSRLEHCISRVRNLLAQTSYIDPNTHECVSTGNGLQQSKQKLAVENCGKAAILNISDIILACSCNGQVMIHTENKSYQTTMTLHDLQLRLCPHNFFRCHRSYLVNVEKIREVIPWFNATYNLVLEGLPTMEVPVSRQQVPNLKSIFDL